jgi:hypothetical protein
VIKVSFQLQKIQYLQFGVMAYLSASVGSMGVDYPRDELACAFGVHCNVTLCSVDALQCVGYHLRGLSEFVASQTEQQGSPKKQSLLVTLSDLLSQILTQSPGYCWPCVTCSTR